MASREQLSPRDTFRTVIVGLSQVMKGEPKTWGPEIARGIRNARHELDRMPPGTREYLVPILERAERALREEFYSALRRETKAQGKDFKSEAVKDEDEEV